jgi:hypothetical protein
MSEFDQPGWGSQPPPPPAMAPGWGPPGSPVTPRNPSRFAPNRPEFLAALKAGAIAVAASVACAIASGYLIILTASQDLNSADRAGLPSGFKLGLWMFSSSFGAPLIAHSRSGTTIPDDPFGGGQNSTDFTVYLSVPLVITTVLVLVGWLSLRAERAKPSADRTTQLVACLYTGAVAAVVGLVAALVSGFSLRDSVSEGFGGTGSMYLHPAIFRTAFFAFLLTALAAFVGRGVLADRLRSYGLTDARRAVVAAPAGAAGSYLVLSSVFGSIGLFVALMVSEGPVLQKLELWFYSFPIGGIAAAEFGGLAPLGYRADGSGINGHRSVFIVSDDVGRWYLLLILVAVVAILLAAIRFTIRRPRQTQPPWRDCLITGGMLAFATLLLNVFFALEGSTSSSGGGFGQNASGWAGFEGFPAFAVAFVLGALIPLIGYLVTPPLYSARSRLVTRIGAFPVRALPATPVETSAYPPQQPPYAQSGYPQPGYPQSGYPQSGYPQPGYPQSGYPMPPEYPRQPQADPAPGYPEQPGPYAGPPPTNPPQPGPYSGL